MFRGSLICFLLVLLPLLAAGQAPGFSPKLLPSSVTVYDIDRGLPISCMDDVYIGPKGQLWINPCRNQDIYQNLSFYAYDGEKANIISLEAPGIKAGSRGWYLNGQLSRQTQLDAFFKQVSFPSICGVSFVKDLQENILVTLSSCFSLQLSLHHARQSLCHACGNTTILSDTVTGYAFCAVNDFIALIRPIFVIADPKK